jgi:glutamate dehydrogenase/leucine dehydrogenase
MSASPASFATSPKMPDFVIQGFGSGGKHAARFLVDLGAVLIGVTD